MFKLLQKNYRFLFGITVLTVIIFFLNPVKILQEYRSLNLFWVFLIIPLYTLSLFVGSFGFYSLLTPQSQSFFKFSLKYFFSQSLGAFLPFQIGESSLIFLARNEHLPVTKIAATFIVDKILTFTVLLVSGAVGFKILFPGPITVPTHSLKILLVFLIVLVLIILFIVLPKAKTYFHHIKSDIITIFRQKKKGIVIDLLASTVRRVLLEPLMVLVLLKSLDFQSTFFKYIFVSNSLGLVSFIPLTPQGLGVSELGSLVLFAKIGLSNSKIISYSLLTRVTSSLYCGLIIMLYSINDRQRISPKHHS